MPSTKSTNPERIRKSLGVKKNYTPGAMIIAAREANKPKQPKKVAPQSTTMLAIKGLI